jgi:hypothetical protein
MHPVDLGGQRRTRRGRPGASCSPRARSFSGSRSWTLLILCTWQRLITGRLNRSTTARRSACDRRSPPGWAGDVQARSGSPSSRSVARVMFSVDRYLSLSFLKERGRSTGSSCVDLSSGGYPPACGRAAVRRRGSGIDPEGRPRSGRRSLTPTPGGARCSGAEKVRVGAVPVGAGGLRSGACSSAGAPAGGQAP